LGPVEPDLIARPAVVEGDQARAFHADQKLMQGSVGVSSSRLTFGDVKDEEAPLRQEGQRLIVLRV
jgi:hypothetical protein